jgi:hypothetical protein
LGQVFIRGGQKLIYEAKFENGEKTITADFNHIAAYVRDTSNSAEVSVWSGGNPIATVSIDIRRVGQ